MDRENHGAIDGQEEAASKIAMADLSCRAGLRAAVALHCCLWFTSAMFCEVMQEFTDPFTHRLKHAAMEYSNQLSGSIPPDIGLCQSLVSLWLQDNNLSGSIPPAIGQLSNLEALHAGGNAHLGSMEDNNHSDDVMGLPSCFFNRLTSIQWAAYALLAVGCTTAQLNSS